MANKDTDISKKKENPAPETSVKPEAVEVPVRIKIERGAERPVSPEALKEKIEEGEAKPELVVTPPSAAPVAPAKSPVLEKIENVLQEDLNDIYFQLPPDQQAVFAERGEETAAEIESLLGQVKIRVSKILELIKRWLRLIPHVNRYFLEQEAKIKTDKILRINQAKRESGENQNKI
ncbi:MAG: hypothetical protein PHC97_03915 [Patescibacteria group bacterium]|nr:hypothetical protein [Patescibacteria group bacterium]